MKASTSHGRRPTQAEGMMEESKNSKKRRDAVEAGFRSGNATRTRYAPDASDETKGTIANEVQP